MAAALSWVRPSDLPASSEQDTYTVLRDVDWERYLAFAQVFNRPGQRITYCEGVLEFMNPSRLHERHKSTIARLIELYAFLRRIRIYAYGSTTFHDELAKRGLEPDECWAVGRDMDGVPDIALEVIQSSPILNKLYIYDGFKIPEVWLFKDGVFDVQRRRAEGGYAHAERSQILPDLDLALVAQHAAFPDQDDAVHAFAAALGHPSQTPP